MRKEAFRAWLGRRVYQGRRLTAKGITNRVGKLPRIERALGDLGFAETDLDTLHASGGWPELLAALGKVAADWHSNEAAARRMAPRAADPSRQLGNLPNVARQYGHFADGKDPNYDIEADAEEPEIDEEALAELKARFLAAYPDFEAGGGFPGESRYHEVEDAYKRPLIAKVQALLAQHPSAPDLGSTLLELVLDDKEMNLVGDYRRKGHLRTVRARSGGKFEAAVGAQALSASNPPEAAADFVYSVWPLVREGSEHSLPYGDIRVLATLFQALARPDRAIAISYTRFNNLCTALLGRPPFANDVLTAAEYRSILDLSRELFAVITGWGWRPRDLWDVQGFVWVTCKDKLDMDEGRDADRIRQYALDNYIAPARQRGSLVATIKVGELHNALGLTQAHANVCQALRGRKFQELADVGVPSASGPENSSTTTFTYALGPRSGASIADREQISQPTNLILYGPPGTGKTWRTAAEAVKLCDGDLPPDREALMARYRELVDQKRIAFVTFHQNFDYESFVEGLRPETGESEGASAGFRLEPRAGIFREICALADQARTRDAPVAGAAAYDFSGRRFWKMGQGAIGTEDDVYEAALANDYVALGWGGSIDWSAERFSTFEAIKAEWLRQNPDDTTPSNWTQTWPFRCEMKPGDIVIVPYGNTAFRAVAEVTGDYRYEPSAEGYYAHRRDVRWLLKLEEPLPLDTIVDGNFTMRTLYSLPAKRVNLPALGRLIAGESGGEENGGSAPANQVSPDQFVLIIDEINRANISKVFGELITLIEPDKRLGMPNALTLTLPYSKKRDFGVPANLHIIGTMNTADRSIAQLDTALRRRFVFREMAPDTKVEAFQQALRDTGLPLDAVLQAINDRIEYLADREHRIGHAFFIGCRTRDDVDAVMKDKVIPLLQEYFFEDWGRVAAVLGESEKAGGFLARRMLEDPTGKGGDPLPSWSVREKFSDDAYDRLIGKVAVAPPPEAIG